MILERIDTAIAGCYELRPRVAADARGSFVKTFHRDTFAGLGLAVDWAEQFYSLSRKNVLRGLHFQTPPHAHAKLVYCPAGEVLDAAVDLRVGSPSHGRHVTLRLSGDAGNMLYLPTGLAHGFLTLSDEALMVYNVTSGYAPAHDTGIRWDSAGIDWPLANLAGGGAPLLSPRDAGFAAMADFASPFVFDAEHPAA